MRSKAIAVVLPLGLVLLAATTDAAGAGGPSSPIAKGPWLQHVTPTTAVVRVEVDPPSPVTLEVVPAKADGGALVITSREPRALHSFLLSQLDPATRYPFKVRAQGAEKDGAVTTAPREDAGAPFRFIVYGDNRSDDAAHASVVRGMLSVPSDFLVNTGDLVENGASRRQWQTFFDIEAPLLRERCLYSAVGNHELVEGAGIEYVRYLGPAFQLPAAPAAPAPSGPSALALPPADAKSFTIDQLSGTFRWGSARFFLLNGMVSYRATPTRAWLEKVLSDADAEAGLTWRIAVVHHGPWSSGPHGNNAFFVDGAIPELLAAHKIDLIISGHDHIYERGSAQGMAYLVSGGGGAPTYRIKKAQKSSQHYESVRHFVEASVAKDAIAFVAIRPDGSIIERCALKKAVGWDCDKAGAAASEAGQTPGVAPSAQGGNAAPALSKCGCLVVGSARAALGGPLELASVCAIAFGAVARRRRLRHARSRGTRLARENAWSRR